MTAETNQPPQDKPKIVVDSDWKAQARAEKDRLEADRRAQAAARPAPAAPAAAGAPGAAEEEHGLPPASFLTLLNTIASQALFALGAMPDPQSGRRYLNLDLARHQIDTLKVLEEKTAGNLTEDEKAMLNRTLYELRTAYVQMAQRVAQL